MNINQQTEHTALESYNKKSDKTTKHSQNGFDDLGIAPSLLKAINRLKFEEPTPIQVGAIPVGIQGDDVIALAQTGSGKTLAYGIPMLQRLSKSKRGTGLVLVPTRELAIQVEEALQAISRPLGIRSAVLIGGASMIMQINILKKNTRVIIATPGRLMDHLERGTVNLSQVETFVLDEADRMLDMGFVPDIKQIMKSIPDKRQTMLFSATMPKPIENIARQLMENPVRLEIDRSGATPTQVKQEIYMIKNTEKSRVLAHHFKQCTGPVLVFTRTKRMATQLTSKVHDMGFAAAEIHSDRSQGQRRNALEGFKRGRYQILIATDIAARGIDVKGIELVVNYDMPANSEDYVHRIGRTGRAGKVGHAISFATSAQKGEIRDIERFMKVKLEISKLPTTLSEKELFKAGEHLNLKEVFARESKPPRRSSSRNSSGDRSSSRKFQSDRPSRGNSSSERPSRGSSSSDRPSKRREFNKDEPRKYSSDRPSVSRGFNKDEPNKFSTDRPSKPRDFSNNRFGSKPSGYKKDSADGNNSSNKKYSSERTSKRSEFFKSDEKKSYKYDSNSKPREFKKESSGDERPARKFSKDSTSKRKDFKKGNATNSFKKRFDSKKNDLNGRSSENQKSKESFSKSMELVDSNSFLKDGGKESPFWSKFAKNTNKKKSVGQGSGRKR